MFLLGHSAGGVISCVYTLEHQAELAGLICESFAFQVAAPDFALAVVKGLSHLAPHAHVLKLKNEDFSRDPEGGARDERRSAHRSRGAAHEDRGRTGPRRRTAQEGVSAHHAAGAHPPRHRRQGHEAGGSQLFYDTAGSTDKTLKLYEGHVHDLLNDIDKEVVMADIKGGSTRVFPRL